MRNTIIALTTICACTEPPPPPPVLHVTSPERGLVQSDSGHVKVTGTAAPGPSGSPVAWVAVNKVPATLNGDGTWSADVDLSTGATLLETVVMSQEGAKTSDVRAVQAGQLRPVGTSIDHAVTAALSAEAFAKLSAAAGPLIKATDFNGLIAPMQFGDDIVNAKLTVNKVGLGNAKIVLTPVDGGLQFSAQLEGIDIAANAAYSGALVIDGSTAIGLHADQVTVAGTLVLTPSGTAGFTAKITAPTFQTVNLHLQADGLIGSVVSLLQDNITSEITSVAQSSIESGLEPIVNQALGALAGPQELDVVGQKLQLQATPSAITFTSAGALVTMNIGVTLAGSESSPGYVFTTNGTPALDVSNGVQLALADDLLNEMFAEVHARGLLDIHVPVDAGFFDDAEIKMTLPPMISANTGDGSMRLVLGDMIASFTDHGQPLVSAAINAQVDLAILRGDNPQDIAVQFGKVDLFVNLLDSDSTGDTEISNAASTGIGLQLDSLAKFLITVPVPSVAGVSLDSLSLRGDSGYVVVAGQIH